MTTAIFSTKEGTLLHAKSPEAQTALISVQGVTQPAILTSFNMVDRAAIQTTPSIGGPFYLYSFGQELSTIEASFVGFTRGCNGDEGGLSSLIAFYEKNKVDPTSIEPVEIVLAGTTIHAFVVGMSVSGNAGNASSVFTVTFSMLGWKDPSTLSESNSTPVAGGGEEPPGPPPNMFIWSDRRGGESAGPGGGNHTTYTTRAQFDQARRTAAEARAEQAA